MRPALRPRSLRGVRRQDQEPPTPSRPHADERVGIWQADANVDGGGFEGELLELVPNERIVFRLGFVGPQRGAGPVYDSRLTITLAEAPGSATALTLVHERLESLRAAMPEVADNVQTGWEMVLDKLVATLGAAS